MNSELNNTQISIPVLVGNSNGHQNSQYSSDIAISLPSIELTDEANSTSTNGITYLCKIKKLSHAEDSLPERLPAELKQIYQWIVWKAGAEKAGGKFDKIPVGRNGSGSEWNKPHQWMQFEDAWGMAQQKGYAGVGIVLPAKLPDGRHLVALDFDGVSFDEDSDLSRFNEILDLRKVLGNPYIERSPSGKGLRMFVASDESIAQISSANPLGGQDELFCESGKWVTVTGNHPAGSTIPEATDEIKIIATAWRNRSVTSNKEKTNKTSITSGSGTELSLSQKLIGNDAFIWPKNKLRDGDGRESYMLKYAGYLRKQGYQQPEIDRMCLKANYEHYEERLDPDVVLSRARRYEDQASLAKSFDERGNYPRYKLLNGSDIKALPPIE